MATYYISPFGNDLSAGTTQLTAWQTIAKVNSTVLNAGDEIFFQGGQTFNGNIVPNGCGTAANPITIASYNGVATINASTGTGIGVHLTCGGFEIRDLILIGDGIPSGAGDNLVPGGDGIFLDAPALNSLPREDYVLIDNVEVSNFRDGFLAWAGGTYGWSNVTVKNSSFHNNHRNGLQSRATYVWPRNGTEPYAHLNFEVLDSLFFRNFGDVVHGNANSLSGSGLVLSNTENLLIKGNEAYENGGGSIPFPGGPIGIWIWESINGVIEENISHDNTSAGGDGGGFDIDGGCIDCVARYNCSYRNKGAGYLYAQFTYANPMFNIGFYYNVSIDDGLGADVTGNALRQGSGFVVWTTQSDPVGAVDGIDIQHNTVYSNNASYPISIGGDVAAMSNLTVANNIFNGGPASTGIAWIASPGLSSTQIFNNNNYSGIPFSVEDNGVTYTSLNAWGEDPNGTTVDPSFINEGSLNCLDYRLDQNSALIDGATTTNGFSSSRDNIGVSVPLGGAADVGAFEFLVCCFLDGASVVLNQAVGACGVETIPASSLTECGDLSGVTITSTGGVSHFVNGNGDLVVEYNGPGSITLNDNC